MIKHCSSLFVFVLLTFSAAFAQPDSADKLDLSGSRITDADLAERLEGLMSLRELKLPDTNITDAGLAHLKNLTSLQTLCVHKTQVGDTGLSHLKGLVSLQSLCLNGTQVSDAGLVHIKDLTSLQKLWLIQTNITDAGLVHLKDLSSLERLYLAKTQITGAGLAHLKNLTSLQNLCVHETQVGDTGLAHLKGLVSLQSLCLNGTKVSDAGLVHLKDLTSLQSFNVLGTQVTEAAASDLRRTLPNYRVSKPQPPTVSRPESPLIGKIAPSFTLPDMSGKQVSLSNFKGKVVLLDFWATWCGPCRQAIPHLEALHKKYKDQGLIVIGINHERDHDKVKEFAKEQISYVVLLDADEQFTQYGISGIPTAFYIDKEEKIRYCDVGFGPGKEKQIEQKVRELLAGKEEAQKPIEPVRTAPEEARLLAFDDFDDKLSLDWTILHADPSHCSLTKKPGYLTITTQKGGFIMSATNFKNLFLIDNPAVGGGDFEITTCIVDFVPTANYHQAGLVCFNDEDNYIKWTYEWNGSRRQRVFALIRETQGSVRPHTYVLNIPEAERVWFRLSKRGNRYMYSTSTDGKSFHAHGDLQWGDGVPKSVGFVAANADYPAPEIDAAFDFFEVRAISARPSGTVGEAGRFVIPQENLQIPEELQPCAANLQKIHTAIKRYEEDRGKLPDWLSNLVPDYLSNEVLLCPSDAEHRDRFSPDPKLPCSYSWQFSPETIPTGWDPTGRTLYRDWKAKQVELFGDVVPKVRCHHHGSRCLNLSVGGQIWWGPLNWEYMFKSDYRFGEESPERQQRVSQPAGQLRIAGVVRDEAGKSLAGVKLQVLPMSRGEATSDSQGRFEVAWIPRRLGSRQTVHYLVARLVEHNLAIAVEIDEETENLDLKLKPGVTFTGEVVDPDGKGISNAQIMIMLRVSNWGSTLGRSRVETNAAGKFEVRAIPPDYKYNVTASADGYGVNHVEVQTDDAVDNHLGVGSLSLSLANLMISGVVVDADDRPVADARISCSGMGQPYRRTQTDAEGKFTLEKICAGRIRITASVSGTTRLYGYIETDGGASDIKLVVNERPSATRYVPKQTPSLVGRPLPDLKDLRIDFSLTDTDNKMILICFWDMEQRPSRYCMRELTKRAEELKGKDLTVVAVHASKVDENRLSEWIKENTIPFPVGMIEGDEEKTRFAWGIRSLPWLILTDRKHIVRVENFDLAELGEKIETAIHQPLQELSAAADGWKLPENPDPHEILSEAQADARAKRYEDALAKHVWFHRNALKYEPALGGVRLSFALSYWHELGKAYPPALVKLKEIRNEAAKNVTNGNHVRESFHDLAAINRTVGEESHTKEIFVLLDAQNADAAKEVFNLAQPALINAKKYKLCGKYIDPKRSFPRIIEHFRMNKRLAKQSRYEASSLEFADKKFTNDATTLIALLTINGRKAEAEEIAGDAKKEWNNASFHAEIDKALQGKLPKPWP